MAPRTLYEELQKTPAFTKEEKLTPEMQDLFRRAVKAQRRADTIKFCLCPKVADCEYLKNDRYCD